MAPSVEGLEVRSLLSGQSALNSPSVDGQGVTLTASEVQALIERAEAASASNDAIIAVVDREGNILGVRVENGVSSTITSSPEKLTFAIDGAIAKARTGAFFGNDQAPLTSRTIQQISQSTITQREVQSDPNLSDPNSTQFGPGYVAPVGVKGHFPPGIMFTPQVDLFAIEHSNRDSLNHPNREGIKTNNPALQLPSRFNVPLQYIPPGKNMSPPESYGYVSGLYPLAQARGIATLPGGVPLFRRVGNQFFEIGGIGVFFPGTTGYATEENSKLNDGGLYNPAKRDRSMEAEFMAFAAAGGSKQAGVPVGALGGVPTPSGLDIPFGRIDLVGLTLDTFGGHGLQGVKNLLVFGRTLGSGPANRPGDQEMPVDQATPQPNLFLPGQAVPSGWLVTPHDGEGITAADVVNIVNRGIAEANVIRAAIRLPLDSTARMVFAVADRSGQILGIYRMPDATVFSIDVAVAKARNVAYYANANLLQPQDQVSNVPAGVAFTSRTFRYLALPHFPEGIDTYPSGPFSILNDPGIAPNATNAGPPQPASVYQTVLGYDSFHPGTNFRDPGNIDNQNGVVFFPGSAPLYKDLGTGTRQLVGGLGVSGDGVDQDDDVTFEAAVGYEPPPTVPRADNVFVRGVRLPYQKFNRQPHEPYGQPPIPRQNFGRLPVPRPRRR